MKRLVSLACLLTTAFVMTACGGPAPAQPPAPAPAPAATPGPPAETPTIAAPPEYAVFSPADLGATSIRVSWWGGDARHERVNEALNLFESRYPNITVHREYGAFTGFLDRLVTDLAAGTTADITQSNYSWLHTIGDGTNVFLDLREVSDIIDITEFEQGIVNLLPFVTTADGQVAAAPHGITGRVILYNRHMLAEHGFSTFPQTIDELIAYGEAVAAGNAAVDVGATNTYAFWPIGPETFDIIFLSWLYNHTGRNLHANGQMLHTVDEVEQAFELMGRLIESGTIPSFDQWETPRDATNPVWMTGRAGAAFEWVGNVFLAGGNFMDGDLEGLGVALLPPMATGDGQAIMQRPSLTHAIARTTAEPQLAAYLLNFLYTDLEALEILGNAFGVPLTRTAGELAQSEGLIEGLMLEGFHLLNANFAIMCELFEDPNLRAARFHALESFWIGASNARQAAEAWVNNQQIYL
jgi:oligogalacturonide transport system substrate-binding protein